MGALHAASSCFGGGPARSEVNDLRQRRSTQFCRVQKDAVSMDVADNSVSELRRRLFHNFAFGSFGHLASSCAILQLLPEEIASKCKRLLLVSHQPPLQVFSHSYWLLGYWYLLVKVFFPNMVFYMFRVLFLKAPAKGFSQRTAANFNFSLHLHNIYFLSVPNIIYLHHLHQLHVHHIHPLHHLQVLHVYISPTKLLQCDLCGSYTGVLTTKLLHRSTYTGVVTQELLCFIGVNF